MHGINEIKKANCRNAQDEINRKAARFAPLRDGSVNLSSRGITINLTDKEEVNGFLTKVKELGERTGAVKELIESFFKHRPTWQGAQA